MKEKLHNKALLLRKSGMSYSQIKNELGVSKSTLSYWLRSFPLSKERIRELRDRNEKRIERYRETMLLKRQKRLDIVYDEEKSKLLPLSEREIIIGGMFLYWGEGSKSTFDKVCISNTDPQIIRFALYWITHSLKVPKKKIHVSLHLYNDMNVKRMLRYWSILLKINENQFNKPYIKQTSSERITHRGYRYGTCNLIVHNTALKERILMGIKSIADYFGNLTE
ncbi:MAG: helix-turn-helix domain-containing protein [Candidatus Roizmanbacteria bacterium]|nr:helix-turn-helix domain-containing protein [Candidatus Roizmanbacteria bacterium]